ncbi:MAG TPA: hypothetical protein VMT20_26655 [Terriglobia bacterium]|nr:hypothetical protein [Terriglobia bacterium]
MIYTLYSYKGGVGRSMALANLAECFFEKNLRIIMIDWDLEAPGLEAYFYPPAEGNDPNSGRTRVTAHLGLIDMLTEYTEKFPDIANRQARVMAAAASVPGEVERRASEIQEAARITREFLQGLTPLPEHLRQVPFETGVRAGSAAETSFSDLIQQNLTPVEEYLQIIHGLGTARLWLLTAGARPAEKIRRLRELRAGLRLVGVSRRLPRKRVSELAPPEAP